MSDVKLVSKNLLSSKVTCDHVGLEVQTVNFVSLTSNRCSELIMDRRTHCRHVLHCRLILEGSVVYLFKCVRGIETPLAMNYRFFNKNLADRLKITE